MLVIYVITAVISYLCYIIIKIKIQDWYADLRMNQSSLKEHIGNGSTNDRGFGACKECIEISDDESDVASNDTFKIDSAYACRTKSGLIRQPNKQANDTYHFERDVHNDENTKGMTDASDIFQRSTDLESDENTEHNVFPSSSASNMENAMFNSMFNWKQENKRVNKSKRNRKKKKSKSIFVNHSSSENLSDFSDLPKTSYDCDDVKPEKPKERIPAEVIVQQEKIIAGTKVKLPVIPYRCQTAVMNALIQGCTKMQNCLVESPTGSGKTLALLCGALAWQDHYAAELRKEQRDKGAQGIPVFNDDKSSAEAMGSANSTEKSASGYDARNKHASNSDTANRIENEIGKNLVVPKVYYGTRTHKQIEQVIRELNKTVYRYKRKTILSSREHTCIQKSTRNKTELCNELLDPKKHTGCPYYNDDKRKLLSSFAGLSNFGLDWTWDLEDLVTVGRNEELCPYFAARNLMQEAEVVFCPYNYLIDPTIRDNMRIDLKNQIIIIDEAHNIEDVCREVASVNLREDYLMAFVRECETLSNLRNADSGMYNTLKAYVLGLVNFMKKIGVNKAPDYNGDSLASAYWSGSELLELFNIYNIGHSRLSAFLSAGKQAITDYKNSKEEFRSPQQEKVPVISDSGEKILTELIFGIQMICSENVVNDYRACVIESTANDVKIAADDAWTSTRKQEQRVRTLKLICLNPGVIFSPLAQSARSIILASGTLAPISSFQSELATEFGTPLSASHVIPNDQVYVTCIPKGPNGLPLRANYQNVNSWSFQDELGYFLLDVCESVPHGVLCFFSSYHVMNTQIERWRNNSIWSRLIRMKRVFLEPRYANDLTQIMKEYREAIEFLSDGPVGGINGALFFAVFRGKVAEGIDFSDNEARCVITVGIPYPVRKEPTIDMKLHYNDTNSSKGLLKGDEWYKIQAFRALNQALGRCVRHKDDWGTVLLVDDRFLQPQNISYLPKWIKSMWTEQKGYNIKEELRNFVSKQVARESKKKTEC